jgi:hypothetical protein
MPTRHGATLITSQALHGLQVPNPAVAIRSTPHVARAQLRTAPHCLSAPMPAQLCRSSTRLHRSLPLRRRASRNLTSTASGSAAHNHCCALPKHTSPEPDDALPLHNYDLLGTTITVTRRGILAHGLLAVTGVQPSSLDVTNVNRPHPPERHWPRPTNSP